MATKLYIKHGPIERYMGQFKTREKAEEYFETCRALLRAKFGINPTAIYVDTGKGRGK